MINQLPVYLFTGFLEGGKTHIIQESMEDKRFNSGEKTLIIQCEEGIDEFDLDRFWGKNVYLETIENEEDITKEYLSELGKKHRLDRVIIEYNGMWNFKEMKLPWHWKVEQQITTIDASSFTMYFTNMKSLLAEMLRKSEMIIFNRCDGIEELSTFKRNVKAINQQAEIIFEDSQGEINQLFEDDLPYDLNAPVLELDNIGYGIWYLDSLEHLERYIGKTISFVGMVLKPGDFPKGYFVPGRMAMTCCADDMAFLGFACEYEQADKLSERAWVKVTAKVVKEYFADYQGEGPVLKAISVESAKAPKEEIISFV